MTVIRSQYTLRLELVTFEKIKKIAKAENRSLNKMIDYLVKKEVSRYEELNGEIPLSEEDLSLE